VSLLYEKLSVLTVSTYCQFDTDARIQLHGFGSLDVYRLCVSLSITKEQRMRVGTLLDMCAWCGLSTKPLSYLNGPAGLGLFPGP
jgi:hypothetical protein